jgi:hypothetical protein
MPLYAQGHSLATYLIESRGRQAFLSFLTDGLRDDDWQRAVHQHYGFNDLVTMQHAWNDWVKQGRPRLSPDASPVGALAAQAGADSTGSRINGQQAIYRGQSPDDITPIPAPGASQNEGRGPVTVASASGSVYAEAAARAQRQRQRPAKSSGAAETSRASVYDTSRATGVVRR